MPKIAFVNEGHAAVVPPGVTVLQAAIDLDVNIGHVCGGNASCSTCRIEVVVGPGNLTPINPQEIAYGMGEGRRLGLVPSPRSLDRGEARRGTYSAFAGTHDPREARRGTLAPGGPGAAYCRGSTFGGRLAVPRTPWAVPRSPWRGCPATSRFACSRFQEST